MKFKNRRTLSFLMAIVMVLTMAPFHPLEVRAAATPALDLGYVRVTGADYQLPNATFGSTGVVNAAGGYFTVAVNSGSIEVGTLSSGITELTNGVTISGVVTDQSTSTNRVFNFSGSITYEEIQAAIRTMKFKQVSGQLQSVTVHVAPGAQLKNGKTSVRTYNGRHFSYVERLATMTFKDAVTIAMTNSGHLVEPKAAHPEEMFAIASLFKEFKSPYKDDWHFLSFIGATKTTGPNWSTSSSDATRYVSNGQITDLDTTKEIVPNGTYDHLTLVIDTNNTKIGYLPVKNIHGSGAYQDPGVIVEYNSGVIGDIITATKDIVLPVMGGSVTINGIAKAGQTLTADTTGITYTPNPTGDVPIYQWYRNGVAITNATGSSYTLTADDMGEAITVTVTADDTHAVGKVTSAPTAAVTKDDGPTAPSAPVASGVTPTSITLQAISDQEYSMDGGLTWQDSPTFSGLTPDTDYTFVTRVKATATQNASAVSGAATIRTLADKTQLQAEVDKINLENLQAADYTPASWQELQDALKNAQNVLGDPNATQTHVDEALQKLTEARAGLKTDKTELQNTVKDVEAFINGGTYNKDNYTLGSVKVFEDALTRAKDVLGNPNASQQEIDQANKALKEAHKNLVTKDAILDKLELKVFDSQGGKEIQLEPPFDGQKYLNYSAAVTDSVYSVALAFEELHTESSTVVTFHGEPVDRWDDLRLKPGLNEITVTVNFQGKENTYTVIIHKADKTKLQELVDKVNGEKNNGTLKEEEYTADSWKNLEDALTKAEQVLINPAATQQEIDHAKKAVEDARNGLKPVTPAKLISLTPSSGSLSPSFDPDRQSYTMTVTNSVYKLTFTPVATDPGAKIEIRVNGGGYAEVQSGTASSALSLNVGTNTIVVKVTDSKGKVTEYTLTVTREYSESDNTGESDNGNTDVSNGGSTPTTPVTPKPDGGIETTLNGKDNTFATGETTTSGDRKITSVQVDPDKLNDALEQGSGQKLAIHSPSEGDVKVDGLTAADVKQLADKGASLEISNPLAIYPVPGGKMDLTGVSKQLGNAALGDIKVHIDITRASDTVFNNAQSKAAAGGYELLVPPVDLDLTFSHDGKTVQSEQLNGYAPKYIALPEGIDPNRITTGVIVYPDGSVFHVPTVVTKIDNRYYAMINDLRSHGSYSVIWNPQDFDDVKSHWGKMDVNNIAARLDLAGTGSNTFSPDRMVTRYEFATIVSLGLGLMRQDVPQNIFPDVEASTWYSGGVAIATEFDIVRGYEDGMFHGNRQITREQGMAMVARAYKLIHPEGSLSQSQMASLLAKFEDEAAVSGWAREDVARLVGAGIIEGSGAQLLTPQANMTRAEATAMIARLLKITDLIDK